MTRSIIILDPKHPIAPELLAALVQLVVDQQREIADWVVGDTEGTPPEQLAKLTTGGAGIWYEA